MDTGIEFDDGKITIIDSTTSATYTYIYKSLNPNASQTTREWLCKRVTNASGTSSFANGVDNFLKQEKMVTIATGLTATYAG